MFGGGADVGDAGGAVGAGPAAGDDEGVDFVPLVAGGHGGEHGDIASEFEGEGGGVGIDEVFAADVADACAEAGDEGIDQAIVAVGELGEHAGFHDEAGGREETGSRGRLADLAVILSQVPRAKGR